MLTYADVCMQNLSLAAIGRGRDVIGIAETGAGKTLAYGLAIINDLLARQQQQQQQQQQHGLHSLIICPTRELAMQVTNHLNSVLQIACPPHLLPPKTKKKAQKKKQKRLKQEAAKAAEETQSEARGEASSAGRADKAGQEPGRARIRLRAGDVC